MHQTITRLSGSSGCFVCDNDDSNPRALRLELYWNESLQLVEIPFTPDASWCGYDNVVHGGLAAAVLDEAMAWAVKAQHGEWAFTAEFQVRYKEPLMPGNPYKAWARVVEDKGRVILVEAKLEDGKAKRQSDFPACKR